MATLKDFMVDPKKAPKPKNDKKASSGSRNKAPTKAQAIKKAQKDPPRRSYPYGVYDQKGLVKQFKTKGSLKNWASDQGETSLSRKKAYSQDVAGIPKKWIPWPDLLKGSSKKAQDKAQKGPNKDLRQVKVKGSNKKMDQNRKAKKPGKRGSGKNTYYEYRENRSDIDPKRGI